MTDAIATTHCVATVWKKSTGGWPDSTDSGRAGSAAWASIWTRSHDQGRPRHPQSSLLASGVCRLACAHRSGGAVHLAHAERLRANRRPTFQLDSRPDFGIIEGEVLDVEPPSLLRCRWTIEGVPTTVTMRLEADGDGTLLELEHSRLTPEARPHFDDGWSHKLQADLGLVLTGERDPALSQVEEGLHRYTSLENDRRQRAEGRQGGADPT